MLIGTNEEVFSTLNDFFSSIVSNLKIIKYKDPLIDVDDTGDPILKAVVEYRTHTSVKAINKQNFNRQLFSNDKITSMNK